MKKSLKSPNSIRWGFRGMVGMLLLLLGATYSVTCVAGPFDSPVGTVWDCVVHGQHAERGVAFLNFSTNTDQYGNYTFEVAQIHTPIRFPKGTDGGRNLGGGIGRSYDTNSVATTNLYGYFDTTGSWSYDTKGRVVGYYTELVLTDSSGTNYITNQVSFVAKVTPNKRLTALAYNSLGRRNVYRGVPQQPVTGLLSASDLSGQWQATETIGESSTIELFNMSGGGPFPNSYTITGGGPGYDLTGRCLVSSQKKIAFALYEHPDPTNTVLRAAFGTLKNSKKALGSKARGTRDPGTYVVRFDAWWLAPSPN